MDLLSRIKNKIKNNISRKQEPTSISLKDAKIWFENRRHSYDYIVEKVYRYVNPNGVYFDIGANIGFFSKILLEKISFTGTAHLFEPIPHLANLCEQLFFNSTLNINIHAFGLGSSNTQCTIFTASDGNIGWNTIVEEKTSSNMKSITIDIKTIDSLNLPSPQFIKIDVEGSEYQVLAGMIKSLKHARHLPIILCEIGWGAKDHPHWDMEVSIFNELFNLGYKLQSLEGKNLNLNSIIKTTDTLLIPG
ncbi:FkbM family methyltransferase [Deltaproteobacteria bacterium PRO3]|nr:FkbM family methyltransferase [Deltaproteobacteria bacterium PRO3]